MDKQYLTLIDEAEETLNTGEMPQIIEKCELLVKAYHKEPLLVYPILAFSRILYDMDKKDEGYQLARKMAAHARYCAVEEIKKMKSTIGVRFRDLDLATDLLFQYGEERYKSKDPLVASSIAQDIITLSLLNTTAKGGAIYRLLKLAQDEIVTASSRKTKNFWAYVKDVSHFISDQIQASIDNGNPFETERQFAINLYRASVAECLILASFGSLWDEVEKRNAARLKTRRKEHLKLSQSIQEELKAEPELLHFIRKNGIGVIPSRHFKTKPVKAIQPFPSP